MCSDRSRDHSRIPFSEETRGGVHLNTRRVFEGLLIAALTAILTASASAWATTKVLSERMERQRVDIEELKREIRDMRRDLYRPRLESSDVLLSDLTTELKDSLHDAGEVFETTDFQRHVRIALRDMALHKRPRELYAPLTLEAGQRTYPAPADLASVIGLDWVSERSREPWHNDYPGPAPLASVIESSSGREIRLSPPPTAQQVRALNGECDLIYLAEHQLEEVAGSDPADFTVTSLDEADRYLVLLRAQAEACRELAMRNVTKPVELRGGGLSQPRNDTPRALYAALLAEWRDAP
jgi:hypothetical protein